MNLFKKNVASTGNYRWVIASLLLFSTTINYMDRQVIGYVKEYFCTPVAKGGFGWTDNQYSYVTAFFTGFYAFVTIFAGLLIDKIGTKLGLALSLTIWSTFGLLNAFAGSSVVIHTIIRSLFGLGEAGNFPASIKTIAEWFPKKERALATGVFNSGANIGAMIAALFVPWCLIHWGDAIGWKMAYIITGATGFIWLIFWFVLYNPPFLCKRVSKAELDLIYEDDIVIHAAPSEDVALNEKISWWKLFSYAQTWSFFFAKFLTDGVWWFLMFWLPDYLKKQFDMDIHHIMWPIFTVYLISILGSTLGGKLPLMMINKGVPISKARMKAMFIIALFPLCLLLTQYFGNKAMFGNYASTLAVAVICIGAAAHQAWSANLFTTVSDMFPKNSIGSVIGIGQMASGIGGVLIQRLSGILNTSYPASAYMIMFSICALTYMVAWSVMGFLNSKATAILV